eukprot:TRINITY_DN22336_c0_g1_i1.p1 TRINITY_DN22336_c0_g1~~TRINITY_DN22336_c0_g1_i1.p1  ORF type:complete len:102 (-),score=15.70 TRINITY_DN22336_c0_g1_i1:169-474(-)
MLTKLKGRVSTKKTANTVGNDKPNHTVTTLDNNEVVPLEPPELLMFVKSEDLENNNLKKLRQKIPDLNIFTTTGPVFSSAALICLSDINHGKWKGILLHFD